MKRKAVMAAMILIAAFVAASGVAFGQQGEHKHVGGCAGGMCSAAAMGRHGCGGGSCGGGSLAAPGVGGLTTSYLPQSGDLLFVAAPFEEASDMAQAITTATASRDSIKFSHVAMVVVERGSFYVLEASLRWGVTRVEWSAFLSEAPLINGKPGVVVKRVSIPGFPMEAAVSRAKLHKGEPYDQSFRPDNGKMYCSELIYESYRYADGRALFTARPMNFRDANGRMPPFWTEWFQRLGEAVPEGVSGTNPQDLSKEKFLKEVYRFF